MSGMVLYGLLFPFLGIYLFTDRTNPRSSSPTLIQSSLVCVVIFIFIWLIFVLSLLSLSPYAFHAHKQDDKNTIWLVQLVTEQLIYWATNIHWGQGPIYPVGTWWVHCRDRQHLTTMYPVIKNWVHFECSLQWIHNVWWLKIGHILNVCSHCDQNVPTDYLIPPFWMITPMWSKCA